MGPRNVDFSRARPEENRFTKVILAEKLDEPVELAVLPGERVLFIERHGYVNLYKPAEARVRRIATIPVSTKYADSSQAEDGLLGLAADPSFAANGWVYMYYSPAGPDAKNVLARFTLIGDSLDLASKKVLLEIPTQRLQCCHTGGSIAFDRAGNRYPYRISVDTHTGFIYWGEVGPDADVDSVGRGPRGYDEINQARSPGNYGWPYFVGNNQAYYRTTVIDSVTTQGGPQFDPAHPVNNSPNNTGLNELPPARSAYIWYPYAPAPDVPIVGPGGRTAEAAPVLHRR